MLSDKHHFFVHLLRFGMARVKERVREVIQKNNNVMSTDGELLDEEYANSNTTKKAVYDIINNHFTPFII